MDLCNGNRVFSLGQETIFKYHLQESHTSKDWDWGKTGILKMQKILLTSNTV